jgi:hypothetical protein
VAIDTPGNEPSLDLDRQHRDRDNVAPSVTINQRRPSRPDERHPDQLHRGLQQSVANFVTGDVTSGTA